MEERLGVFGGTFDPVHIGHLVAAVNVRHALALDRVLMVVANHPWQKGDRVITPAEHRVAVVEAAVAGDEGLEASRLELDRGGESYSADTLEELAAEDPSRKLFLIVGADVAAVLGTWSRVDVARRLATLVVVNRAGARAASAAGSGDAAHQSGRRRAPEPVVDSGWRVVHVEIPGLDVSSSEVRARARAGLPLEHLVPAPAIARMRELGLYAGGR